ncbi:hypothetical protein HHI36_016965 [Cryptolaemus montrouzieri]|uniref:Uncharacterized protein n=1 Tax=Cryptolaemus montrouzieri TaxID=559131 RepID=A0ABD2NLN5_9CUCU
MGLASSHVSNSMYVFVKFTFCFKNNIHNLNPNSNQAPGLCIFLHTCSVTVLLPRRLTHTLQFNCKRCIGSSVFSLHKIFCRIMCSGWINIIQ